MKFKFSKILMGVSALIVAGIVSVVPFNKVQAATTHLNVIDVFGPRSNSEINGNIVYTYSGTSAVMDDPYFELQYSNQNNRYEIYCALFSSQGSNFDSNAACSVDFSFNFAGSAYAGTLNLLNENNYFIIAYVPLGYYLDPNVQDAAAFSRGINEKVNEIDMAFNGLNPDGTVNATKTVEYNYNYAISEKIIEKLAQAEGVTLLYTFEYEGYVFTSAVTSEAAAQLFSKDIPWYGPCYIASNCPTVMVGVAN